MGFESFAHRFAGGRAVGNVEATIVFGAFDELADDQSFSEMSPTMGADSGGGVQ